MNVARNGRAFPGFNLAVNHDCLAPVEMLPWWGLEMPSLPEAAEPAEDEDAQALARGAGGDEQAWQQLFDRWKKPLLAFFYRSLGSMADAEDLTLEVFVRLHRAAERYTPRASFATFLFHIARNLLLNELRRRRRKPAQPLPPEEFDYLQSPGAEENQRLAALEEVFQQALTQLPENQRTLLLLVYQQNLAPREIAEMLSITENALRVQLHRARQRLKELMQPLT